MNIREIVKQWLIDNKYDGLYSDDCACVIDDLIPCDFVEAGCKAGHRIPCPGKERCDFYGDCKFHIGELND